ncbi:MAG TPA: hypothetical protein VJ724_05120, partial [Tahibacter sp.]|nr:hypothetical protein [Tahibacter sp.]
MRTAIGLRGSLAAAAFCLTLMAGLAGAQQQQPQAAPRFDAALDNRIDPKGSAPMSPVKTGAGPNLVAKATMPKSMTSNQYPPEVEPNDTSA